MYYTNMSNAIFSSISMLKLAGVEVDTGHWQGVPTEGKPDLVTREILNVQIEAEIPPRHAVVHAIQPNLPWAEDHFLERVARKPTNPGDQYKNWPWWQGQDEVSMSEKVGTHSVERDEGGVPTRQFTHTYQERFWPKFAGRPEGSFEYTDDGNQGIRYTYGDLGDVLDLLWRHPFTRQATFPIFFPEDTGAVHGGRVPCTLHYHFLRRGDKLHLWYPIRSCDAVRHFKDDLYMACRLCHWVIEELGWDLQVTPGKLHFTAYSFHVHKGDEHLL